jgi:hypothetical protein
MTLQTLRNNNYRKLSCKIFRNIESLFTLFGQRILMYIIGLKLRKCAHSAKVCVTNIAELWLGKIKCLEMFTVIKIIVIQMHTV